MPYTGTWVRRRAVPQASNLVWGTGYNPVHERYGSEPARLSPIPGRQGDSHAPFGSVPEVLVNPEQWGYTVEDSAVTGLTYDGRPAWNEQPEQYRGDTDDHPPWSAPASVNERFRGVKGGAHRFRQKLADALPSETVSEGWLNKPKGQPADAKPSDPAQYEIQTSMRQRELHRTNDTSVARGTDEPREGIASRIVGQRVKVYSGGQRHDDMLPREQTQRVRPFFFRTAGTGQERYMEPNTQYDIYPIERVPPPDPYIGEPETEITPNFGYTPEDQVYA